MSVAFECKCGNYTVPTILDVSQKIICPECLRTIKDSQKLDWLFRYLASKETQDE